MHCHFPHKWCEASWKEIRVSITALVEYIYWSKYNKTYKYIAFNSMSHDDTISLQEFSTNSYMEAPTRIKTIKTVFRCEQETVGHSFLQSGNISFLIG
jgi:hypothetical protein